MEPRYLLDTDICLFIRQRRPARVLHHFRRVRQGEAAISVITYGELLYGAARNAQGQKALDRLRALIAVIPPLPLPEQAAEIYGAVRADLESRGEMIGNNDLWIAAHALAARLILITNNESEFRRISGLRVQNWAK